MATKTMRNSRKSLALALAVVGVAGLSMASAAQLTVISPDVVAGFDTVAACGGTGVTGVTVTYTPTYTSSVPGYTISSVRLVGAAADSCSGTVRVTVTGASNLALATGSIAWDKAGVDVSLLPTPVSVADITGIAVAIG